MRVPAKQTDSAATTGYEAELWAMADTLRGSMDAGERLAGDRRWRYGLAPKGVAGFVLANNVIAGNLDAPGFGGGGP